MRLYGHCCGASTRRVLLTLAEKAHPVDLVSLDPYTGEHLRPAHLARHPFGKIHEPPGLRLSDQVEGDEDVVGNTGIGEDLRLAELLAGDAGRAGLDLHGGDGGYLVGLDVRPQPVGTAGHRHHPSDVLVDPVRMEDQRRGRHLGFIAQAEPIGHAPITRHPGPRGKGK